MQDLIDKLKANADITDEQAQKVLETLRDYVKQKYPVLATMASKMFSSKKSTISDDTNDPIE